MRPMALLLGSFATTASLLPDTNREPRVVLFVGYVRPWGVSGDVMLWLRRLTFCGLVC